MIKAFKNVAEINGKKVLDMSELRKKHPEMFDKKGSMDAQSFEQEIRPNFSIFVRHDMDSISFNIATLPAKEGGKPQRCQPTDLISVALHMLKYYNKKMPCRENSITITKLEEALMWQEERTRDRTRRAIEGTSGK